MASQTHHAGAGLEVVPDTKPEYFPHPTTVSQTYYPSPAGAGGAAVQSEKTICGVRRPTFWLSLALLFAILAAGIGGGVGGSLAVRNAKWYLYPMSL